MIQNSLQAIEFNYLELANTASNLDEKIEKAFGPKGHGVCVVSGIPYYQELREQLLPLSYKLSRLPKDELQKLERPEAFHSKGWSCGVEQFKGKIDVSKGSFYNNPLFDMDDELSEEELRLLSVNGAKVRIPNVWPKEQLPELEFAFKNLGRLMIDVGCMLLHHIDKYVASLYPTYKEDTLYRMIKQGNSHVGRLLHYFAGSGTADDDWCGWHNDHSLLTALTSAMYLADNGEQVNLNDPTGGLMAKNRFSQITQIRIPKDCLAFQIGETAQILTGGLVEATPHCVVRGEQSVQQNLNRNTFALFMGPNFNYRLNPPEGVSPEQAMNREQYEVPSLQQRWHPNITFAEYSENSYKMYAM